MASIDTAAQNQYAIAGVMSRLGGLARAAGDIMMRASESHPRVKEIERLKKLTDAELEALGIRGDGDLVRFAFRDMIAF